MPQLTICLLVWLFLSLSARIQTPQVDQLQDTLHQVTENGQAAHLLTNYTYTLKIIKRKTEKNGVTRVESETFEAYAPSTMGRRTTKFVLIKTKENDQPVEAKKLEKERLKAGEKLLKADTEAQKNSAIPAPPVKPGPGVYFTAKINAFIGADYHLRMTTLLSQSEFSEPQTLFLNGREILVLKYCLKPQAQLDKEEQFLRQTTGTISIDRKSLILVEAEGWPVNASLRGDKPVFRYQQTQIKDGFWLPRQVEINCSGYPSLFGKLRQDFAFEFSEYNRFQTEAQEKADASSR
ncbi:MAG: hypothetical protein K1Y36_10080 [Blastocatellia bacterium]|nr:hypothetical protein [Blastocatellia bacterium]